MLSGMRTYIVSFLIAVATFCHSQLWIDDQTYNTIVGILGATGLAALRAGVSKK